jgi:hypothetical protein
MPRKEQQIPIEYVAGWVPELVWTFWRKEKSLNVPRIELNQDSSVVQPIALQVH